MISRFRARATALLVPLVLAMFVVDNFHVCRAQSDAEDRRLLLLSSDYEGKRSTGVWRNSVPWKGRGYDVEAGIDVLMSVVRHPEESARLWNAATAITGLAMLGGNLKGHPSLDELAKLYDTAAVSEKRAILTCFITSGDPRGIPVFTRRLDKGENIELRLSAARGLARWNVRRGVAELIDLFESTVFVQHLASTPIVGNNALQTFRTFNDRKDWGFPENEWWKSIDGRADLDQDQKKALRTAEIEKEIKAIKAWFAENKERFPDWKLGDPLPEVAPSTDKRK